MKINLHPHHQKHVQQIGIPEPPSELEVSAEEYEGAMKMWESTGFRGEDLRTKVAGHLAWKHHHRPKPAAPKPRNWEKWYLVAIGILLIIVLLSVPAHCQFSKIKTISVTDGTTTLFAAATFTITYSGCTVGGTGSAWTISCTGSGGSPHNLLSATHSDTTASAAVRGGGIFAIGASPTWTQVAHSAATGGYFKWNGTDVVASTGAASGTGTPTACTNQFVTGLTLNADAAPTSTCASAAQASVTNGYVDLSSLQASIAGAKTFTTALNSTTRFSANNMNDVLVVDGVTTGYTTCNAAITTAGVTNKTIIVIPSTYAGAACTLPVGANITIEDFSGPAFPGIRADTNRGHYITVNGTPEGSVAGFSFHGGVTSPFETASEVLVTSKYSGTLPVGQTLASLTAENDIVGAVTASAQVNTSVESYTAVRSTGGTLPDVRGLTGSVNIDLSTATTNITDAIAVMGQGCTNTSSSGATIANCYAVRGEQPTVGTARNFAMFSNGAFLMPNNVNFDVVNSSGTAAHFITFNLDNSTLFRPRGTDQAGEFQWSDTTGTIPIMTLGTTGGVVLAGICKSSPAYRFQVECATAGDIIAKFKNTSATGFGVKFVPGLDANYALNVQNAAETQTTWQVLGNGSMYLGEVAAPSASAANAVLYADSTAHVLEGSYNNGAFSPIPLTGAAQTWAGLQTFTPGIKTGSTPPACTAGTSGLWCGGEGTAPTNVASTSVIYPSSTTHEYMAVTNGASSASPGMMVRVQPSAINNTAKTAAVTTATLCAASAGACNTAGQYRLAYNVWGSGTACATVTAGSVVLNFTWTDENAVTHTTINAPMWDQKTSAMTAGQTNFNTALGTEGGSGSFIISTNGTIIQYATTYTACTSGTGAYNVRIAVERLQ